MVDARWEILGKKLDVLKKAYAFEAVGEVLRLFQEEERQENPTRMALLKYLQVDWFTALEFCRRSDIRVIHSIVEDN